MIWNKSNLEEEIKRAMRQIFVPCQNHSVNAMNDFLLFTRMSIA